GSRASQGKSLDPAVITEGALNSVRALDAMAQARGQTLAKMAIAWVLRHGGITTALIGASRPEQVVDCCGAISNLDFSDTELAQINQIAGQKDVNLWARSAQLD
ncbi:MAG: aldo/keto reductase, partial [Rhodobacter sp.]|nr:aldo/keto reductase [Rhodobacter sp.]